MDPAQDVPAIPDLPFHQGYMVLSGEVVDIAVDLELPIAGGKFGRRLPYHVLVVETAVVWSA